jgi:hypothetical protein
MKLHPVQVLDSIMITEIAPKLFSNQLKFVSRANLECGDHHLESDSVCESTTCSQNEQTLNILKRVYCLDPARFLSEFNLPVRFKLDCEFDLARGVVFVLQWIVDFETIMGREYQEFDNMLFDLLEEYLEHDVIHLDMVFNLIEDYTLDLLDAGFISESKLKKMLMIIFPNNGV